MAESVSAQSITVYSFVEQLTFSSTKLLTAQPLGIQRSFTQTSVDPTDGTRCKSPMAEKGGLVITKWHRAGAKPSTN